MKWIWHYPDETPHLDFFINPLPAAAMAAMALNDHWLKYAFPGFVTGKLSDFLGVFYFPLFLCALVCLAGNGVLRFPVKVTKRVVYINRPLMMVAVFATAALMVAVKGDPSTCQALEDWFSRTFFKIRLVADPTDLWALVVLPLSYRYAAEFFNVRPASLERRSSGSRRPEAPRK